MYRMYSIFFITIFASLFLQPLLGEICEPCEEKKCPKSLTCGPGEILREKGDCGCCDDCIAPSGEGEVCGHIGGEDFSAYECTRGLICTPPKRDEDIDYICRKASAQENV